MNKGVEMKNNVLINSDPKSPVAEAYRTLRTNIEFSSIDKKLRTIVITSSGAGEGKSTTSINLAFAFVQSGKKVLLLDADLRRPMLHKKFEITNQWGLSTVLIGEKILKDCTQIIEGLEILSSGPIPPNPSEMLGSTKMKSLLDNLKEHYDYIIIDSPPVGFVTDSALLAASADGTILTVAVEETEKKAASYAKLQLSRVNANILGVVLTKIPQKNSGYYKYHYSSYYKYAHEKG